MIIHNKCTDGKVRKYEIRFRPGFGIKNSISEKALLEKIHKGIDESKSGKVAERYHQLLNEGKVLQVIEVDFGMLSYKGLIQ